MLNLGEKTDEIPTITEDSRRLFCKDPQRWFTQSVYICIASIVDGNVELAAEHRNNFANIFGYDAVDRLLIDRLGKIVAELEYIRNWGQEESSLENSE